MNYVDFIFEKVMNHIQDANETWVYSNALAIVQSTIHHYYVKTDYGKTRANDYFTQIGLSGANKSLIPNISTVPILEQFEREHGYFDDDDDEESERKSIFLPDAGSSEGLALYMSKTNIPFGIIDQDEISKMIKETKGKGWKAGDIEFLSKLWDGRTHRSSTTSRGYELVERPYVVMVATSTQHLLEYVDAGFFRQGMGNRIVWSYLDHIEMENKPLSSSFFDEVGTDKERFSWWDKVIAHLNKIFNPEVDNPMFLLPDAKKLWIEYEMKCRKEWLLESRKNATGWEFQPIKRFPHHALKISMTYAMGDENNLDKLDMPVINKKHMKWAIDFMEKSRLEYEKIRDWKILNSGKKAVVEDYTDVAKYTIAKIKANYPKKQVFYCGIFYNIMDSRSDYERKRVFKRMKEMGLIIVKKKSELSEEQLSKTEWPTGSQYNSGRAVVIL